jgi:BioD-like phosphotransacetylase family protein
LVALYVTSLERSAGKTAICAALGKRLQQDGKKVGFFKPINSDVESPSPGADSDARFIKEILGLKEPETELCPVISGGDLAARIKEAYDRISSGKDIVLVEGVWRQRPGARPIETSYEVVKALGARVIIVEGYSRDLPSAILVSACRDFGEYKLGVVLNKVPRRQLERNRGDIASRFNTAGLNILGMLPEDRVMSALTVGELAGYVQGKILNSEEQSTDLVENFMLGAFAVDPGPVYFGRKVNKAAIVRSERADMQIAALATSTRCLVLAGNTAPIPHVLGQAKDKGIPIIAVGDSTIAIVNKIENALDKGKFNQEKKMAELLAITEQYLDFPAVYKALGLAK